MTGYGTIKCVLRKRNYIIEMRSVNSKQLDLNIKLNHLIKPKENEIKQLLTPMLERGKIDFAIYNDGVNYDEESALNEPLVKQYYKQLNNLAKELKVKEADIFSIALKMPNVYSRAEELVLSNVEFKLLGKAILQTIKAFDAFRLQEGNAILADFKKRIALIEKQMLLIIKEDTLRLTHVRSKLTKSVEQLNHAIDANRFEQEIIYYLEKLDITEEVVRLKNHLEYFKETLSELNSGKKLNFIAQEIGREINTIGSKANYTSIQHAVVMMKDELEKIKEQINNVL